MNDEISREEIAALLARGSEEMTREEAIEELSILLNKYQDGHFGDAIDMAMTALEQEPCNDTISRAEVHDLLATWLSDKLDEKTREVLEVIDGKVEDMPSVTPKQSGWHYTDLPPSDDPYKRYLVVYSPYDRNYGRNTAPRFEIADYYKGDGLYNDKPWHLTISHSVMEKEILAWKDIGIVDEVMQGAKMEEQA